MLYAERLRGLMDFSGIIYMVLWGVIALYCFISARKVSAVLYVAGTFFLFMFTWNLADLLAAADLFSGMYGIIFRCVAAGFLIALIAIYIKNKKSPKDK